MKALSIRQPWAWLIMHGGKTVENRNWSYVPKLRGRIYIHAAKGMTQDEYDCAKSFAERIWAERGEAHAFPAFDELKRGGIIGTADITGYIDNEPAKMADHPWYLGTLGIELANPQPCEFRPLKGMLGFFETP